MFNPESPPPSAISVLPMTYNQMQSSSRRSVVPQVEAFFLASMGSEIDSLEDIPNISEEELTGIYFIFVIVG